MVVIGDNHRKSHNINSDRFMIEKVCDSLVCDLFEYIDTLEIS